MDSIWTTTSRTADAGTGRDRPPIDGTRYDDVVVGAGLTGLATALQLREAGRSVLVLEADADGASASAGSLGVVGLLQGTVLARLRRHHSRGLVRGYVDANRDGFDWLLHFCASAGVPVERVTEHAYAATPAGLHRLDRVRRAARDAGLPVRDIAEPEGPAHAVAAIALDHQALVDPVAVLDALVTALGAAGAEIRYGVRVTGVRTGSPAIVTTSAGTVSAENVVLATAAPILARGLYPAKTRPLTVHGAASPVLEGEAPSGIWTAIDAEPRTLRPVTVDGERLLAVSGDAHPAGVGSTGAHEDALVGWLRTEFHGGEPRALWSGRDLESDNLVPFVGALPGGRGHVYFATGFGGWGMTNAPAAALRISTEILGREKAGWMNVLGHRVTKPADLGRGVRDVAVAARAAGADLAAAARRRTPIARPAEGTGVLVMRGMQPVGISTVGATTRAVAAWGPGLAGLVRWNDLDAVWESPLDGSRFAPDGRVLAGPAVRNLDTVHKRGAGRH